MALPPLPSQGQDPWYEARTTWDNAVKDALEGRLSEEQLNNTFAPDRGTPAVGQTVVRPVGKSELVANVLDYGAVGDGITDSTAAIQAAIDAASLNAFQDTNGVVYLPPGTYSVTTIVGKDRVTIRGAGQYKTVLRAMPSSEPGLIQIAAGQVKAFFIEDMMLAPGAVANVGQSGVYAHARLESGGSDAGWWNGGMRRVRIYPFDRHNIWLRGGGTDYMRPHQFLVFDHVFSYSRNHADSRALLATGQVGQVTVLNGEYSGGVQGTVSDGVCVELVREVKNDGVTVNSDASPYAWVFLATTFQANMQGVRVQRGSGNVWIACWFEDLERGISFSTAAEQNEISGCTFSDAGSNGLGTGYCVNVGSTSHVHLDGNRFAGSHDRGVVVDSSSGHVTGDVGYSTKSGFFPVTGMTKQPTPVSGAIDLGRSRTAIITAGTDVSTINGKFITGDVIHLRAQSAFNLVTGGNLNLGGRSSPLAVPVNACATFVKMDLGTVWQLVCLSI